MSRIGRVVLLGVLLVGVLVASAMTVPGTLATGDPPEDPSADCEFSFTAYSLNVSATERPGTPYEDLDPAVRDAFDRRLAQSGDTITIDQSTWADLDAAMNLTEYVVYEETVYLIETRYSGCERWEAEHTNSR